MFQITIEETPLYKLTTNTLSFRDGDHFYKIGNYEMTSEIRLTPFLGNVELLYHQREFNMITLNNLSLISLFSEAYNYRISKVLRIKHESSCVAKIIQEFHLDCEDCNYVIMPLSNNTYYIFIFEKPE